MTTVRNPVDRVIGIRSQGAHQATRRTIYKWSVLKQEGHFSNCSGEIVLDREDPTRSRVQITVPLATIDTRNPHRDSALRGEDFFGCAAISVHDF
jgi:polyisoprenoid-binding protein YceI